MFRLLCSGRIRTAVRSTGGNVLDLGRTHRVVTERQFQALLLRDEHCTFPGCVARAGIEAHHVRHRLHGGPTDLDNLVLLCRAHHHAHHDGEFVIEPAPHTPGHFEFRRSDGHNLPAHVDSSEDYASVRSVDAAHRDVEAAAATTKSSGQRLDRQWAITVLAQRCANERDLRAG